MNTVYVPGAPRGFPLAALVLMALSAWVLPLLFGDRCACGCVRVQSDGDLLAVELRRFRALTDTRELLSAIDRIGPIRDPRVTVALVELIEKEAAKPWTVKLVPPPVLSRASVRVLYDHIPEAQRPSGAKYWTCVRMWWDEHGAEVKRRAAALSQ